MLKMYSWNVCGNEHHYVGTEVDCWELVGEFAIVKNTVLRCWHLVDRESGALVATRDRRSEIVRLAKRPHFWLTQRQRAQAKLWAAAAELLPSADFFVKFRQYKER